MKKRYQDIGYVIIIAVLIGIIIHKNREIKDIEMVLEQCSDRYYKEVNK